MTGINKKSLTERDICTKFINPALEAAGWDLMHQIREQYYFTKGRVIVRGKTVKRGDRKFPDYILFHKPNIPLAVIEWNREFRVTRWNGQAERVFGWAAAEVLGKAPFEWRFVLDEDRESVAALLSEATASGQPRTLLVHRN